MAPAPPIPMVYPYKPLKQENGEIRLVRIQPASNIHTILECRLVHVSIDELPQYRALSYTWGSELSHRSISLDGYTVFIRENLENALRRLRPRSADQSLLIWIDAICINQNDNSEKSEQISKMRFIFERANDVCVWIGPASRTSPLAFRFVRDLASCARNDLSTLIQDPARVEQIEALRELFYRDYWWRIWVIQEVVVAKSATVYCGNESISWPALDAVGGILAKVKDDLVKTMYHDKPDSVFKLLSSGPRSMKLPVFSEAEQPPLMSLLRSHKSKFSSDARDKVYGLVGISDARTSFKIDYSLSEYAIYIYTAKYIISTTQSLDVICLKTHDRNQYGLPSWSPDWTRLDSHTKHRVMGLYIRTPKFKAAGDTRAITIFGDDERVLITKGIRICRVGKIGATFDLNEVSPRAGIEASVQKLYAACETFHKWWDLFIANRDDSVPEQSLFERTIFGGTWSPDYELHQQHRFQLFSSLSRTLITESSLNRLPVYFASNLAAVEEIDNEKNQQAMVAAASLRMHGKRLIVTDSGLVGLAPWNTAEGDIICVLFGCSFPVVLRPIAEEFYLLIGEVYVDELMTGKAVEDLQEERYVQETFKLR